MGTGGTTLENIGGKMKERWMKAHRNEYGQAYHQHLQSFTSILPVDIVDLSLNTLPPPIFYLQPITT
jgi:hypothetical protein